jgi:hypothetical protein
LVYVSKSRPFSIYLLKPEYGAGNSLVEDHKLIELATGTMPEGASLFILDGKPSDPW